VNGGEDDNPENNTITKLVKAVQFIPDKRVLVEEATGTWCGWCVRGIVYMDSMKVFHNDIFIGVAVHTNDPMANEGYIGHLNINGYPGCKIDRLPDTEEVAYLEELVTERVKEVSVGSVEIENFSWDPVTRIVNFDVESEFICDISDDLRFTAIIVENGVTGTGSGYAQNNAYAGGTYGPMGGFENLPSPVPAADMVYNDVGRLIIGGFDGVEGSLPAFITANSTHSYTFTETIPEDWDFENLVFIGAIIDVLTGQIINANTYPSDITEVQETHFEQITTYPNPFDNSINITNPLNKKITVELIDLMGRIIQIETANTGITLNTAKQESGVYLLRIKQDNHSKVIKLVK